MFFLKTIIRSFPDSTAGTEMSIIGSKELRRTPKVQSQASQTNSDGAESGFTLLSQI